MLGPALRQLLKDLDDVPDPSGYEAALRSELAALAELFGSGATPTAPAAAGAFMGDTVVMPGEAGIGRNVRVVFETPGSVSGVKPFDPLYGFAAAPSVVILAGAQTAGAAFDWSSPVTLDPGGLHSLWAAEMTVGASKNDVKRLFCLRQDCENKRD